MEEMRRLFYVALTRAKHHVSLMLAPFATKRAPVAVGTANGDALTAVKSLPMVNAADLPAPTVFGGAAAAGVDVALDVNGVAAVVRQTYRRTSFTGITAAREGAMVNPGAAAGAGADEMTNAHFGGVQYAPAGIPTGADMPLARVPGGTMLGKVMHSVYELLDFAATDLPAEVEQVVQSTVTGSSLRPYRTAIAQAVVASLTTPLSGGLAGRTLSSFATTDRLAEMDFEMGLPAMAAGVTVRDVGRVLVSRLADDDVLMPYAQVLAGRTFDIPLAGLLNGSIDALLRTGSGDDTRLYVTDYKTNRLDTEDDTALIDAYEPSRLVSAMEHHHYPLQALIYGTAVHRWLRWRAPHLNADATVAGISYFFVRGMCGPSTPVDAAGDTYGVFTWTPPAGLWSALSGAMNGGTK